MHTVGGWGFAELGKLNRIGYGSGSGAIANNFDKDAVQKEIGLQVSVTQQFDTTRQGVKAEINKQVDKQQQTVKEAEAALELNPYDPVATQKLADANAAIQNWQQGGVLVDMIAGGLSGPTSTGAAGTIANAAAPGLQFAVGQYFKGQQAEGSTAHVVAHTVLAAAVAAAGGNDALTAGLSAGGAEALAPVVSNWLFGKDAKELTADEKATVSNIVLLGAAGLTASAGGTAGDVVSNSQLASSAVEDNYLTKGDVKNYVDTMNACKLAQGAERDSCIQGAFTLAQKAHLRNEAQLEKDCSGPTANAKACNTHKTLAAEGSRALREQSQNLMITFSAPNALSEMKSWQLNAAQATATLNSLEERKEKNKEIKDNLQKHKETAQKQNSERTLSDNAKVFTKTVIKNGKEITVAAVDATADAVKGIAGVVSSYDAHEANQRTQDRIIALANGAAYIASGDVIVDGVTYGKYLLNNPSLIVMNAEDMANASTTVASVILVPKALKAAPKAANASVKVVTESVADWNTARAAKVAEKVAIDKKKIDLGANADNVGLASSIVRDFKPGTTHRAENINAGQVTDRDGLQRVDDAKTAAENQIRDTLGQRPSDYWPTARPAWKEGTIVTDRVTTKPETFNMVVDKKAYNKIEEALKIGDTATAAKYLGGWATPESIKTVSDVRNKLAISSEWKGLDERMYSIQIEVQPGAKIREGTVGDMWDKASGIRLQGGGQQVQLIDHPSISPNNYKIDLNKSVEIK